MFRSTRIALVVLFALLAAAQAQAAQLKVTWQDLLPNLPKLDDPLEKLTVDQRIELETVLWVRQLTDAERAERPDVVAEAEKSMSSLAASGVVVDDQIKRYVVYDAEVETRSRTVRSELDGMTVTIEGYILPLEFSEDGETEFLLVPYVGACIHVPPPPPNQIVLASLTKKFLATDLFMPVRITGKLLTKSSSKTLFLVDGGADISLGYHLEGGELEVIK